MDRDSSLTFDLQRDWESTSQHLLLNPRLEANELAVQKQLFEKYSLSLASHLWINSSGSSSQNNESLKLIALSKQALLASAKSVNFHLAVAKQDVWLNCLPVFHVGGLGIFARAFLSQSRVVQWSERWDPAHFCKILEEENVTLTSLVPTQVYDLVKLKKKSPLALRAVVVGGAALDSRLHEQARLLGWPLLPSYGMTETCSQVATAELASLQSSHKPEQLKILSHAKIDISEKGVIQVAGDSLLSGYAQQKKGQDIWTPHAQNQYYLTADYGKVEGSFLSVLGREQEYIKILGEGVSILKLESRLRELFAINELIVVAIADERAGYKLQIQYQSSSVKDLDLQVWNSQCNPVERIASAHRVSQLPKTELGKWLRRPI